MDKGGLKVQEDSRQIRGRLRLQPSSMFSLVRPGVAAVLLLLPLCFVSCTRKSSDVLAKGYVAPATVNLRRDLTEKNSTVTTLRHGQEVEVIGVRRVFLKVRAPGGAEGWLSAYDLLTSQEMQQIERERQQALQLPSEGSATVYGPLNIHIEPGRDSPAFARIKQGDIVHVLAHRAAERTRGPSKRTAFVLPPPPAPQPASHRKKHHQVRFELPKPPPPPGLPSGVNLPLLAAKPVEAPAPPVAPVTLEDWTLVRTKSNVTGWVLSRDLFMTIPADVEQYAEGKRITSYFDLGAVTDSKLGETKHNWLWTTASKAERCDFDSWRVFLWNVRHHRYETSYRQRDVEGYFPVHVDPPDADKPGRTFELKLRGDDGQLHRQTYWFDGVRVHLVAAEDASSPAHSAIKLAVKKTPPKTAKAGWFRRKLQAVKRAFGGS